MFEPDTIATSGRKRLLSPHTEVDVALLRDPGDRFAPAADLLRSPAYFRVCAKAYSRAWYAVVMDGATGESLAGGWFAEVSPGEARSGSHGMFGALHSPCAPLPAALAARIVRATEEELVARHIAHVSLTLPPAAFDPVTHAEWMNVLLRLDYTAAPPDLSFFTRVTTGSLAERMDPAPRSAVRSADGCGLSTRELLPTERAAAHTIIAADHQNSGRAPLHSLETLLALESEAPGAVHWHGAFVRQQMVAASISLSLSDHWCRMHGMGHVGDVERENPSALLVAHLHSWCASRGIASLDLGLASTGGLPDEHRTALARALGFESSAQYTLSKPIGG
jgi:hypothetical protein